MPLDEAYFPDEYFRAELGRLVDENNDGILSRKEREKICYLMLNRGGGRNGYWYSDMNYPVNEDFLVSQLTYMHLENIYVNELDVDEISGLQVLRVILPEGSGRRLPALNLSKNEN